MVTIYNRTATRTTKSAGKSWVIGFRGLSTDEKPTNVGENSTFLELDTGVGYYFSNGAWHVFAEDKPEGMVISTALIG